MQTAIRPVLVLQVDRMFLFDKSDRLVVPEGAVGNHRMTLSPITFKHLFVVKHCAVVMHCSVVTCYFQRQISFKFKVNL